MFRSDLKYDWDDQIEQVLNETIKKLEALISPSSNQKKKEQYINDIVDTFEKTLNSDASIELRRRSSEKLLKISEETWIMWKKLMKQEVSNSENDRIQYFHKVQQVAKILKKAYLDESKQLKEAMLDLNTLRKKIQILERSKLHRQDAILTKSRREHAKLNWTDCYNDDCIIYISDKEKAEWFSKRVEKQRRQEKARQKTLKKQYEEEHSTKNRTSVKN